MRYLVIHSMGYGGQGPWYVDFEIEADSPDASVKGVFEHPGADPAGFRDAKRFSANNPDLNAGDIAKHTGGQFIGLLAQKDTGMVVFNGGAPLSRSEQYPWAGLNEDPLQLDQREAARVIDEDTLDYLLDEIARQGGDQQLLDAVELQIRRGNERVRRAGELE